MLVSPIILHLIVSAGVALQPGPPTVERAITRQINTQVAQYWPTARIVWSASPRAIPVHVMSMRTVAAKRWCGLGAGGCHWVGSDGQPIIAVGAQPRGWSGYLSHEVIETVIDPSGWRNISGHLAEVCDPVSQNWYRLGGTWVADFVSPRWFIAHSAGPFDYLHASHRAGQLAAGGYMDSLNIKSM
jgi:hypothetical protein